MQLRGDVGSWFRHTPGSMYPLLPVQRLDGMIAERRQCPRCRTAQAQHGHRCQVLVAYKGIDEVCCPQAYQLDLLQICKSL